MPAAGRRPPPPGRTKLARLREERRIDKRELAQAIGLSYAQYRRLEDGEVRNPKLAVLMNVGIALDVPLMDVLEPSELEWTDLSGQAPRPPSDSWYFDVRRRAAERAETIRARRQRGS